MSEPRVDWCSYCKKYKDPIWGAYFGPHDSFFQCADCCIEQAILHMESNLQTIKVILANRKKDDLNGICKNMQ